jgi:hypothetical protein
MDWWPSANIHKLDNNWPLVYGKSSDYVSISMALRPWDLTFTQHGKHKESWKPGNGNMRTAVILRNCIEFLKEEMTFQHVQTNTYFSFQKQDVCELSLFSQRKNAM